MTRRRRLLAERERRRAPDVLVGREGAERARRRRRFADARPDQRDDVQHDAVRAARERAEAVFARRRGSGSRGFVC